MTLGTRMTDGAPEHRFPVRVYYEDTDAGGIVYYANYLKFAERARTEFLRSLGSEHHAMKEHHGVEFVVRSMEADYILPARLDDELTVCSCLITLGGASMTARQIVKRDDEDLVNMSVQLACVSAGGKPARMPGALRIALKPFQHEQQRGRICNKPS
jgi:acyl-CoA thioester hydrolase